MTTTETYKTLCDFCNDRGPTWVLPAHSFGFLGGKSVDDWLACNDCAVLLRDEDWDGLVKRVEQHWARRHGTPLNPIAVETLRLTYRRLRLNIRGPLRPL